MGGVEGHGTEGVAEDVAEEVGLCCVFCSLYRPCRFAQAVAMALVKFSPLFSSPKRRLKCRCFRCIDSIDKWTGSVPCGVRSIEEGTDIRSSRIGPSFCC